MLNSLHLLAMAPPPAQGGQPAQSPIFFFVWIGIMIAIFYVMIIRPQRRRESERQALMQAIKTGDRILFSGGIIGVVANVKEKTLVVKVGDKMKLEILRAAVSQVLEKGELPAEVDQELNTTK